MKPMKYFTIDELVNPQIMQLLSLEMCWNLIPDHVRYGLDRLRELYGSSIAINTSQHHDSGIRLQNSTVGATYSAHKGNRGLMAFDCKCADPEKLRNIVREHFSELNIAEMEDPTYTVGWTHLAFHKDKMIKLKIIRA